MLKRLAVLSFAAICSANVASAGLKVSLVTVAPGPELFDAFGHAGILIQNTASKGPGVVYEYSGFDPSNLNVTAGPIKNLGALLDDKAPAKVLATPADVFQARYLDKRRDVWYDALNITEKQAGVIERALKKDAAAGTYMYGNYSSNCATKLRDVIFSLVPKAEAALDVDTDKTPKSVTMEAIDYAAALSPTKTVRFPIEMLARTNNDKTQVKTFMKNFGIPAEYKNGNDFDTAMIGLTKLVKFAGENAPMVANMSKMPPAEANLLPTVAKSFETYMTTGTMKNVLTKFDGIITPKQLREALGGVKNGPKVILDIAKTKVVKPGSR